MAFGERVRDRAGRSQVVFKLGKFVAKLNSTEVFGDRPIARIVFTDVSFGDRFPNISVKIEELDHTCISVVVQPLSGHQPAVAAKVQTQIHVFFATTWE